MQTRNTRTLWQPATHQKGMEGCRQRPFCSNSTVCSRCTHSCTQSSYTAPLRCDMVFSHSAACASPVYARQHAPTQHQPSYLTGCQHTDNAKHPVVTAPSFLAPLPQPCSRCATAVPYCLLRSQNKPCVCHNSPAPGQDQLCCRPQTTQLRKAAHATGKATSDNRM
jgi:hypothetical protein